MPEKSGMDAALCAPLLVGPTAGVTACPTAAVTEAATAANVANKRKSHRRTPMATSLSWFRRHLFGNATAFERAPERGSRCLHLALLPRHEAIRRSPLCGVNQTTSCSD